MSSGMKSGLGGKDFFLKKMGLLSSSLCHPSNDLIIRFSGGKFGPDHPLYISKEEYDPQVCE